MSCRFPDHRFHLSAEANGERALLYPETGRKLRKPPEFWRRMKMAPRSPPDFWATLPPPSWARARKRARAVARYLKHSDPTLAVAEHYAAEMGTSVRTFYRLVASYKAARVAARKTSRQGLWSPLEPTTAAVLDAVIKDLGPAASDSQIHAECRARCVELSLQPPSLSAVRTRTGKLRVRRHLAERLHLSADLICDSCPLLLDIGKGGIRQPAWLTGLIDVASGTLLVHRVHAGATTPEVLTELTKAAFPIGKDRAKKTGQRQQTLVVTRELDEAAAEVGSSLISLGLLLVAPARPIRSGAALIAVLGRRIGRIPFAPLRRSGTSAPTVPIAEARRVVEYLLAHPDL